MTKQEIEAFNSTIDLDYELNRLFTKVLHKIPGITYQSFLKIIIAETIRIKEDDAILNSIYRETSNND